MKKLIPVIVLLFLSFTANSTDLLGGEITWKCVSEQGISKYKFKLVLYATCGPGASTSSDLKYLNVCNTNVKISQVFNNFTMPGTNENIVNANGKILVKKTSTTTIIPNCTYPTISNYTCTDASSVSYKRVVYESEGIDFHDIRAQNPNIPILFSFNSVGRYFSVNSNAIVNEVVIVAKMFSYFSNDSGLPQSIQQCSDNAPDFSEAPIPYVYSNGLEYTINNNAIDVDNDNLVYGFSNPYVGTVENVNSQSCPFDTPDSVLWNNFPYYNSNNPLGLVSANYNLNIYNGEFKFKTNSIGKFVMVPTIYCYRNGQKIAEIRRDFVWQFITSNSTSNTNLAPVISKPFLSSTGTTISYKDVVAGSSVCIPIVVRDSMVGGGGISPHEVQLTVNGIAMGTANADTLAGCPFPNCAILSRKKYPTPYAQSSNPMPEFMQNTSMLLNGYGYNLGPAYSANANDTVWLYWKTDFSNLNLFGGMANAKMYDFSITAKDNFCIPKLTSAIFSINVVSPNFVKSPKLTCVDFLSSSNAIKINWLRPTGDANTFVRYDVYRNSTLLYSTNNLNQVSYLDNSGSASKDSFYYVRAINTYDFLDNVTPVKYLQFNYHSNDSMCIGTPTVLSVDTIVGGNKPYSSIRFLGDEGLNVLVSSDIKTINYTFSTPGIKKYAIVVTDASGCTFEIHDSILVKEIPSAKIVSDKACKSSAVNFTISDFANSNLDSIWWRGDFNSGTQNYMFDLNGKATDVFILNPKHIFTSNNGVGKFPVSARLKNSFGCVNYIYDTVDVGFPVVELMDPSLCCNSIDTITFSTSYLTKPYVSVKWIDNANNTVLLSGTDKFPVSILSGRTSITLMIQLEDAKGCEVSQIKNYNLTTGVDGNKQTQFAIYPNPANSLITLSGLPENELNDLYIFDVLGKQVYTQKVQGTVEVDLSSLSKGVYFVRVGATTRKLIRN